MDPLSKTCRTCLGTYPTEEVDICCDCGASVCEICLVPDPRLRGHVRCPACETKAKDPTPCRGHEGDGPTGL